MFFINLNEIINSIDSTLEKNVKSYNNSFADIFIDELKNHLNVNDSMEKLKSFPKDTLFTLDRYEGNFAICENRTTGEMINIPKSIIDSYAKEGNILKFKNGKFQIDIEKTKNQNDIVQDLFKKTTKSIKKRK